MKIWILCFLSFCSTANAQWSNRPQIGLGYTDNSNFEETEKDPDFFYWLRISTTLLQTKSQWHLWLNTKDYFKENQNDVFSYRLGHTQSKKSRKFGEFDWDLALGGMQYYQTSPGTTEESFSNIYGETSLLKTWIPYSNFEITLEPGYLIRYYPSFSGRTDHTALIGFVADWNFAQIHTLSPFSELGFVFSNQSLYSKYYLEFGADWTVFPEPDLKYIIHFLSKYSTFPSRQVSESTVVSNKRGQSRTINQNEIESQSFVQIQGSIVKMIKSMDLTASLALNSQSSRSGIEDYQEIEGWVSLTMPL